MTEITTSATPAAYAQEHTARATGASNRFTDVPVLSEDLEKDDMDLLRAKLAQRKKPIYAGLAFMCVVVVGVSIAVTSGGSTTQASTSSGFVETLAPTPAPSTVDDATAGVHAADLTSSGSGSVAGEASLEEGLMELNSTTPEPTTETPTPAPTTGPILPFKSLDFDWKNPSLWEYADGGGVSGAMVTQDGIKLTPANSAQPIRTKQGWGGEKIVYFEWERSPSSDTNIWMLNTKLQDQFAKGNGWPYWGEIDIFEMFTQDKIDKPKYDFTAHVTHGDVSTYGQLTLHNGPKDPNNPCYCPSSGSTNNWYQNSAPMTSGCTAQFPNPTTNSMATIWGSDGNGQYLQLIQNPTITKGGKLNNETQTYDITAGSGIVTPKIYNNKDLFWGTPASAPCAAAGGHNPSTGFPFFEDFRIILEEQKKNDGSAWFKVNNIQIFKKT